MAYKDLHDTPLKKALLQNWKFFKIMLKHGYQHL